MQNKARANGERSKASREYHTPREAHNGVTHYDGDTFSGTISGGNNGGRQNAYSSYTYTSGKDEDEERIKVLEERREQLLAVKRAEEEKARKKHLQEEIDALEAEGY
ncbi:hypothetical protein ONZ45_g8676 [Pleurotus djamor]|nr:hypothetical protein ONZ45_g8676 [Pleurotus djamor]